jgi:hypothetical protein
MGDGAPQETVTERRSETRKRKKTPRRKSSSPKDTKGHERTKEGRRKGWTMRRDEAQLLRQLLLVTIQATALLALVSRHLRPLTLFSTGHRYLESQKMEV